VVAAILFGLAGARVRAEFKRPLVTFARGVAELCFVLVSWVLRAIPVAAFAVAFPMAATAGAPMAGAIGYYLVVVSALLIGFTFLLYPITWLAGGVTMGRFARGVAPAQAVAAATRSSLASLPPLLECAERRLGLRREVSELVLPLSVSAFKVNLTISSTIKVIFLTHLFGVPLAPEVLFVFVMANLMLSFGSPGIPSGGFMISLPFYLAAGAPIEGVVLLRAVDAVPDIFKTVVNVTADMTAATIVERFDGVARVAAHATAGARVVSGADGVAVPVRVPAAALDAMHEREPIA
jgi:Na+/H+-dicarboxylate symporter